MKTIEAEVTYVCDIKIMIADTATVIDLLTHTVGRPPTRVVRPGATE